MIILSMGLDIHLEVEIVKECLQSVLNNIHNILRLLFVANKSL